MNIKLFYQSVKDFIKKNNILSSLVYSLLHLKNYWKKKYIFKKFPNFILRPYTSDEYVFNEVFSSSFYRIDIPMKPKWIIDAGAHIGLSTLYFILRYPDANIVSIEPDNGNFSILKNNLKNFDNVYLINAALWHQHDKVKVHDRNVGSFGFTVKIADDNDSDCINAVTVKDIQKKFKFKTIDIFKIDIEGSEKDLFENEDWLEDVNILIAELHERINPGCEKAFDMLRAKFDYDIISNGNTKGIIRKSMI